MEIRIINLDRRPDRWRSISQRMAKLGLEATRVAATDGRSNDFRVTHGSPELETSDGHVACSISHFAVWSQIALSDGPVLVLEDDAVLDPSIDWPTTLSKLGRLMSEYAVGLLQIGYLEGGFCSEFRVRLQANYRVRYGVTSFGAMVRPANGPKFVNRDFRSGMHAYILSPKSATRLMALRLSPFITVDSLLPLVARSPLLWTQVPIARLAKSYAGQVSKEHHWTELDSDTN